MAKFEGDYLGKMRNLPEWWTEFSKNYLFVIKFLKNIGTNGLVFSENQKHFKLTDTLQHGRRVTISHSLGVVPQNVSIQGGRYSYFTIDEKNDRSITITVYLVSQLIIETESETAGLTNVKIANPAMFKKGDSVVVGTGIPVIVSTISADRVFTEIPIRVQPPTNITLYKEKLEILIF